MGVSKVAAGLILAWLFGWAILFLRFPAATFRSLAFGRTPTPRNLRSMTIVGYMALAFGCFLLGEFVFGVIPIR